VLDADTATFASYLMPMIAVSLETLAAVPEARRAADA
jgi:hypothetical protein